MNTVRFTIPIYGLSCTSGDSLLLERALSKIPGVLRAYVNPATEMAYVEFDEAHCRCDEIANVIVSIGLGAGSPIKCYGEKDRVG